jgi:hypothetical protein
MKKTLTQKIEDNKIIEIICEGLLYIDKKYDNFQDWLDKKQGGEPTKLTTYPRINYQI